MSSSSKTTKIYLIASALILVSILISVPFIVNNRQIIDQHASSGTSSIMGSTWKDINKNGARDSGEEALSNQNIELYDQSGILLAKTTTDSLGNYNFPALLDGDYLVKYAQASWEALWADFVPTTTGSLLPKINVHVSTFGKADFGWRPIIRSTDLFKPIAKYTGPNGLWVEVYNDAVSPEEIYNEVMLGLVGPEAKYIGIRFDFDPQASTPLGWQGVPGSFSNYSAISYAGDLISWLRGGDQVLSHEYGHAWSYYYEIMVQQDSTFSSYLKARGLFGDPRVRTEYKWMPAELIAEDYRQLFGSENAKKAWQMNRDIPDAADVPGLKDFLQNIYTKSASALPPPPTAGMPTVTPTPTRIPDNIAPTAPSRLKATNITASSISLSWKQSTDNVGVIGYKIYGRLNNTWQFIAESGTSFTNSGLTKSTSYSYYVTAYDASGNESAPSAIVNVKTRTK